MDSGDGSDDLPQFYTTREEFCEACDVDRQHHIYIEVITESEEYGGNQPYRVKECQICGEVDKDRIGMGDGR
jgi:hypothetical protein